MTCPRALTMQVKTFFYLYLYIFSCVVLHIFHCPLSGPDLIYISLLIISCIIEYVMNKKTLNLELIFFSYHIFDITLIVKIDSKTSNPQYCGVFLSFCQMSLLPFWVLNVSVAFLSMEGQKALGFHQKYLNLCYEDKQSPLRFETTRGWIINDRSFIFEWTIPLNVLLRM